MGEELTAVSQVRFVRDEPADVDYFHSHSRIARAISRAIVANPELRTIGLLGRWGSGKSTVVYHLRHQISHSDELRDIAVFTFDAWEHQSEPIRRSFLESLLGFLTTNEFVSKETWQPELDALTGRVDEIEKIETPTLSSDARGILISLIFLPVGMALFGLDTLREAFGQTTTLVGRVAAFIVAICFLVPTFIIASHFIKLKTADNKREDGAGDELFAIITNKTITKTRTKTIKSPQPTAIEFSEVLYRLTKDLFQEGKRLLCVIDNLDRLPAGEAVKMWATIRSLFSYKGEYVPANATSSETDECELSHPIVLVPMDRGALLASFGGRPIEQSLKGSNTTDDRASSFIDKAFDITFKVPPPVTSDWRRFLDERLTLVFPEKAPSLDERYFVRRLFAARFAREGSSPTPRSIIRFANALGALWLEREGEHFDFPILAAFVANSELIERNVLMFVQSSNYVFLDEVNRAWRDQVAALHFGVPLEKGRQLLLTQPLTNAIERNDAERFTELMSYPGAGEIFEEITRDLISSTPELSNFQVIKQAGSLLGHEDWNYWWVGQSWRNLTKALLSLKDVPPSSDFTLAIQPFHEHVPESARAAFVDRETSWLSAMFSSAASSTEIDELERAYQSLIKDLDLEKQRPKLEISGEPDDLAYILYELSSRPALVNDISVRSSIAALVPLITSLLRTENSHLTPGVLQFLVQAGTKAFEKQTPADYTEIVQQAVSVTSESLEEFSASSISSLLYLSVIDSSARTSIDAAIDAGHLQSRLNEAFAAEDEATCSAAIALFIAREKQFATPEQAVWQKTYESQLELVKIVSLLDHAQQFDTVKIWKSYYASPSSRELLIAIMHTILDSDMLTNSDINHMSEYAGYYIKPLDYVHRNKLSSLISSDQKFVSKVGTNTDITESIVHFFRFLTKGNIPRAHSQVEQRLELVSVDDWKLAIQGTKQSVVDLAALASPQYRFGVQSRLLEALQGEIPRSTLRRPDKSRRLDLYKLLTVPAKRRFLEAVLRSGVEQGERALVGLTLFGPEISERDAFSTSELSADSFVIALMYGRAGRAWIEAHASAIRSGIAKLSRQERRALRDELRRMSDDKRGDRAEWSQRMLGRWGL